MNSKKLAWHRENGRLQHPKFTRLATIGDKREEAEKKKLSIQYISSTIDDDKIYLTFLIETPTIKSSTATIFVEEMNAVNEIAVPKTIVTGLKSNSKQSVKVSFDKTKKFDRYIWQDGFVYQATITIDDFSAKTDEFKLNYLKTEITKQKTCYCNRDFTKEEVKNIVEKIRENTFYSIDGIEYPISNLRKKLFNRNLEPSQKYITEIVDEKDQTYDKLSLVLNKYFKMYNIQNCIQKIHFLAQMYTETEYFTKTIEGTSEDFSYDPYRGRGFLHLTDKKNYSEFKKDTNIDILTPNYSKVSKDLDVAAHTAAWYWSVRGKVEFNNKKNKEKFKDIIGLTLNDLALFEDKYIDRISIVLNGGTNKINERKTNYIILKNIFEYENCINKK